VFIAKHNEGKLQDVEQGQQSNLDHINMLGTIRLPSNLKMISETLPESNYDSDRESRKSNLPPKPT
jgi:hypothetical protein